MRSSHRRAAIHFGCQRRCLFKRCSTGNRAEGERGEGDAAKGPGTGTGDSVCGTPAQPTELSGKRFFNQWHEEYLKLIHHNKTHRLTSIREATKRPKVTLKQLESSTEESVYPSVRPLQAVHRAQLYWREARNIWLPKHVAEGQSWTFSPTTTSHHPKNSSPTVKHGAGSSMLRGWFFIGTEEMMDSCVPEMRDWYEGFRWPSAYDR